MSPIRVLHIEDMRAINRVLTRLVEEINGSGRVTHAATLAEGLDVLAGGGFDVVILDLSLPDAADFEGLRTIKKQFPWMPVIVLSGMSDVGTATTAIREGAQDFICKTELSPDMRWRLRLNIAMTRMEPETKAVRSLDSSFERVQGLLAQVGK